MYSYMSKISKILITAAFLLVFTGISAGAVTSLNIVEGVPTNSTGNITVEGSIDNPGSDVSFSIDTDLTTNYNQSITFAEGGGRDLDGTDGNFRFEIDLGNYTYKDYDYLLEDSSATVRAEESSSYSAADRRENFIVDRSPPRVVSDQTYVEKTPLADNDTGQKINVWVKALDDGDSLSTTVNESGPIEVKINGLSQVSEIDMEPVNDTTWRGNFTFDDTNVYDTGVYLSVDKIEDDAGNSLETQKNLPDFVVDTKNPSVSITAPDNESDVQSEDRIEGTASDDTNVGSYLQVQRYSDGDYWNGSSWVSDPANVSLSGTDTDWYNSISSFNYPIGDDDEDEFNVTAIAEDTYGNTESTQINFEIDMDKPIPNPNFLASPENSTNLNDVVSIEWTQAFMEEENFPGQTGLKSTDPIEIEYSTDGGDNYQTLDGSISNDDGEYSWNTSKSEFPDSDQYKLLFRLEDKAGNTGEAIADVEFSVDNTLPEVLYINTSDENNDGRVDGFNVTFSEEVEQIDTSDFDVENRSATVADTYVRGNSTFYSLSNNDDIKGTGAQPEINFSEGSVVDTAGNNISQVALAANDTAQPVLMHAELNSTASNSTHSVVRMKFSEGVVDADGSKAVNLSGKKLPFVGGSVSDVRSVNYSEVLDTSEHPNVTGFNGVEDEHGNLGALKSGQVVDVDTFRRQIADGWNYVSFPIGSRASPKITDVFPTGSIDSVWSYRNGEWETWKADKSSNPFNYVRGGVGYLVRVEEDSGFTLHPNVENKVDGSVGGGPESPTSLEVEEGWNLLGQYQEYRQPADSTEAGAFDSLGMSLGDVYGTGETAGTLEYDPLSVSSGENVKPGYAYWVSVEGDLSDGTVSFLQN
jgi:hypothetical protein